MPLQPVLARVVDITSQIRNWHFTSEYERYGLHYVQCRSKKYLGTNIEVVSTNVCAK